MSGSAEANLSGKHVVVTGGGSGAGAETAKAFASAGASVTIMGRREAALRERKLPYCVCDVRDAEAVSFAFESARAERGPVSVVVASAGAAQSVPFVKSEPRQLDEMLAVNLAGAANCWRAALPDMIERGWGRLIAIASTAGLKGYAYASSYCAAKHGVIGLTKALALEIAPLGVTANAICPGFIDTPMLEGAVRNIAEKTGASEKEARDSLMRFNPRKRFVEVDEVAGCALWLCSESARSVNGHALSVSGGEI